MFAFSILYNSLLFSMDDVIIVLTQTKDNLYLQGENIIKYRERSKKNSVEKRKDFENKHLFKMVLLT